MLHRHRVARHDAVRDAGALIQRVVDRLRARQRRQLGDIGALKAGCVRPALGEPARIRQRAQRAVDLVLTVVEQRVRHLKARRAGREHVRCRAQHAVVVIGIDRGIYRQHADALQVQEVIRRGLADRADHRDTALATIAHDLDLVGLARAAEHVDEPQLAEVVLDDLLRAIGEHRIDDIAALRDHADHARRRLDDERDPVVLDVEVADQPALRGPRHELGGLGDLAGEHFLRATRLARQVGVVVAEATSVVTAGTQFQHKSEANKATPPHRPIVSEAKRSPKPCRTGMCAEPRGACPPPRNALECRR